jgi:hypothetical protein
LFFFSQGFAQVNCWKRDVGLAFIYEIQQVVLLERVALGMKQLAVK